MIPGHKCHLSVLSQDQELFFFNDVSPGSCFFLPKGAHIYNTLTDFIKVNIHAVYFILYRRAFWSAVGFTFNYISHNALPLMAPSQIQMCHACSSICSLKLLTSSRDEEQAAKVWWPHFFLAPHPQIIFIFKFIVFGRAEAVWDFLQLHLDP